jgi:hypothetical protein
MENECSCELCERVLPLTSHHLIPKQIHSKGWCKRLFTKKEMNSRRADLCRDCHSTVHKFFTHRELGEIYNTIEKLLTNEKVINFVKWVKKQNKKAKQR